MKSMAILEHMWYQSEIDGLRAHYKVLRSAAEDSIRTNLISSRLKDAMAFDVDTGLNLQYIRFIVQICTDISGTTINPDDVINVIVDSTKEKEHE